MTESKGSYRQLYLNSADFYTGSTNNPTFSFNHELSDFDYIKLEEVIVPFTYYVFSSPSNVSCTINGVNVVWPAGNYTPSEWIAVVVPQVVGLSITYSGITGKMTFTHTTNPVVITFSASQQAFDLLGLRAGTNTNGTTTFVTPDVCRFAGPNFLYLRSSIASTFNRDELYYSQQSQQVVPYPNNILAAIPVTVGRYEVSFYTSNVQSFLEWNSITDKKFDMYFTLGNRTEVVDFNGHTFQLFFGIMSKTTQHEKYN